MGQQLFLKKNLITIEEDEIQGDVLVGLQKKAEIFAFFRISTPPAGFKEGLRDLIEGVATTKQTRIYEESHGLDVVKVNVAFTADGLRKLGAPGVDEADPSFVAGMKNKAAELGDDVNGDWLSPYVDDGIDGVFLIAAWDKHPQAAMGLAKTRLNAIVDDFGSSVAILREELGQLNPAAPGHEVFGFADGVSQPAVEGLHRPDAAVDQSFPGQDIVRLGDFVLGNYPKEDGGVATPPVPWMENGSYLVFRRLRQHVDVFNTYVESNFGDFADTPSQFGARLIGRWKDGSPLARDPVTTNPHHGESKPRENNDFEFGIPKVGQERCPFNAHIRRVYPRSDVQEGTDSAEARRILRAGIAYDQSAGGEVDKGLLFVCYQSSIVEKFEFIQTRWANADDIPFDPPYPAGLAQNKPAKPGIDLIIGQGPAPREADWTVDSTADPAKTLTNVPKFVTATGGGYFFSPSISGLRALTSAVKPAADGAPATVVTE